MNEQMTPLQALKLLYDVSGLAPIPRADGEVVKYAAQLLETYIKDTEGKSTVKNVEDKTKSK